MKKIIKVLTIMLAVAGALTLGSCDGLLGGKGNEEVIEHKFVMEPQQGFSFYYYTSTTRFSYENNPECYYQISFNAGAKTWQMYTRPVSSVTKIKDIAAGTYTGDPSKAGELKLSDADEPKYSQTVTIKTGSDGKLYFVGNVTPAHKAIGAKDAK